MAFVDEEIAKMIRQKRMEEEVYQKEDKNVISEEEVMEGIVHGELKLYGTTMEFHKVRILEEQLEIYIPTTEYMMQKNEPTCYQAVDQLERFSIQYLLVTEKGEVSSLSAYKERMEKDLKPSGVLFQWLEEGELATRSKDVQYLEFVNITGIGVIHHFMFFMQTNSYQIIANINFVEEEKAFFRPIVRAFIKLTNLV